MAIERRFTHMTMSPDTLGVHTCVVPLNGCWQFVMKHAKICLVRSIESLRCSALPNG